ncbi:MAG: UDP-glucose/GDP-mannose dehydrogenase family protein [Acidobacteriia bacterium]|nr:UDP-glucose/GDP-mannose dehydrogenase family protein [Terriglobia bacterium]
MKISVIGLGKLGAVMAAVFAERGHQIIGVDLNEAFVSAINEGRSPVEEPGLAELIAKNRTRLRATGDAAAAVAETDATFIIVPTPSGDDGTFSLRHVLAAVEAIGGALRHKSGYHLVVLSSTVMPGATGGEILPLLEASSGKTCGQDFGLCYNPEFIALGSVIRDMSRPDMLLIGESDQRAGTLLASVYEHVFENQPQVARMNFVNAELAKLSVNTFVTTKISYANMLGEICERLPGADVDEVTRALGLDSRIGPKYLQGALGYGGPCFPRDNVAFARLARNLGLEAVLAEATQKVNLLQVPRLAALILSLLPEGGTVGILGVSYKSSTNIVEESQGIALASHLLAEGVAVNIYDPAAMENAARALPLENVCFRRSAAECAGASQVVVIATPWKEFQQLRPEHLNTSMGIPSVVDCWRILDREKFESVANYVTLGIGYAPGRAAAPAGRR